MAYGQNAPSCDSLLRPSQYSYTSYRYFHHNGRNAGTFLGFSL